MQSLTTEIMYSQDCNIQISWEIHLRLVMLRLFVSDQPFHRHGSGVGVGKGWKPAGRPCTWWLHRLVSTVALACQVCILSVTQQNRAGANMLLWHNKTGRVLMCWTLMPVCYNTTKQDRFHRVGQWCLFAITQQNRTGFIVLDTDACLL